MSNARARAWALHRAALKPKRVTDRVVEPTGATPSMLRDVPDTHCGVCGYACCSCGGGNVGHDIVRAGKALADLFAPRSTEPAPAVPAQPGCTACGSAGSGHFESCARQREGERVPEGWRYEEGAFRCGVGDTYKLPTALESGEVWFAYREGAPDLCGGFASMHAAMLAALGAEVGEAGGAGGGWHVTAPGDCRRWYDDTALPGLVEDLTAERAKPKAPIVHRPEVIAPTANDLAPGWLATNPSYDLETLEHATGVEVWLPGLGLEWRYTTSKDAPHAAGHAPTRDEAMALALAWLKADPRDAWESYVIEDWFGERSDGQGTWRVVRTSGGWQAFGDAWDVDLFPSLPHAIARCRGES